MSAECIWLVGAAGLMGDALERSLERHATVVRLDGLGAVSASHAHGSPNMLVVNGTGRTLAPIKRSLREHVQRNVLVVVFDDADPSSFLFRIHESLVWRQRIGISDIVEILSQESGDGTGWLPGKQRYRSRRVHIPRHTAHKEVV